jgi:hypothetical protein
VADLHLRPESIKILSGGKTFLPHIFGNQRTDGTWEAWIEFRSETGDLCFATARETTQPNRTAVEYWAQGLEPIYFEGAFWRSLELFRCSSTDYRRSPVRRLARKY